MDTKECVRNLFDKLSSSVYLYKRPSCLDVYQIDSVFYVELKEYSDKLEYKVYMDKDSFATKDEAYLAVKEFYLKNYILPVYKFISDSLGYYQ